MTNYIDSTLNFPHKRRQVETEERIESYTNRPLSANKWSQYQVDRWYRSFPESHTKPKLCAQIQRTFVPNRSSHKPAEEMADREAE